MGLILNERDFRILTVITKWRFCLGRQIRILAGFTGQRACDRRISKLIEAGYIERKYLIYGIPGLYFVTPKAKKLFSLEYITKDVRIEQIQHDIYVIDTAIYFINHGVPEENILSERELKHADGFGNPKHRPDFIYTLDNQTHCVEVELNAKKFSTLEKNIKDNYINYDFQKWIVPEDRIKITSQIEKIEDKYSNIEIIPLSKVVEYVKEI